MRLILILAMIYISSSYAHDSHQIVAKIENIAITTNDISDRINVINLIDGSGPLANLPKDTLNDIAIQQMINEYIIKSEAKKMKISLDPKEEDSTLKFMESQMGIQPGKLEQYCIDHKINYKHLKDYIIYQTLFSKFVMFAIKPKVKVDDEIVMKMLGDYKVINFTGIIFKFDNENKAKNFMKSAKNICSNISEYSNDKVINEKIINKPLSEVSIEIAKTIFDNKNNNFTDLIFLKHDNKYAATMICSKSLNLQPSDKYNVTTMVTENLVRQMLDAHMEKARKKLHIEKL